MLFLSPHESFAHVRSNLRSCRIEGVRSGCHKMEELGGKWKMGNGKWRGRKQGKAEHAGVNIEKSVCVDKLDNWISVLV